MSEQNRNQYRPDEVSAPGETLLETLETIGMSQVELAERTGKSNKTINEIVKGKAAITPDTALQLERVLGIPAGFWNNRERDYHEALARTEETNRLEKLLSWVDRFPIEAMAKRKWIQRPNDKLQQLQELLNFFGVASPEQWDEMWSAGRVAFRRSTAFEMWPEAVAAWLRKGELTAQNVDCLPYESTGFRTLLQKIRGLTFEQPQVFPARLQKWCSQVGVAVVFVHELPRTRVFGVTRWLSPHKALIQLSLLYKSDDQLWFSFFHEAAHILLHGKRQMFIEEADAKGEEEKQADAFAADILIPRQELRSFLTSTQRPSKAAIRSFAQRIGIAPGIVVGRLQHDGYLPFTFCNGLKQRYRWVED